MIYAWAIIIALSLILEFVTFDLVTIWFSVGALTALILELCDVGETWQIIAFLVVSLATIFLFRKMLLKFTQKDTEKTNADRLIGQTAKLTSGIEDGKGTVKFNGVTWTAMSNQKMPAGTLVVVEKMDGNKLVVKKAEVPVESEEETKPKTETKPEPKIKKEKK